MGIPFSKQINAAFDEVTPLVAAGFQVLQTTKNIAILLLIIQILTVLLLFIIFLTLIALLISVNPDLDSERREIVTPLVKAGVRTVTGLQDYSVPIMVAGCVVLLGLALGAVAGVYFTSPDFERLAEHEQAREEREKDVPLNDEG